MSIRTPGREVEVGDYVKRLNPHIFGPKSNPAHVVIPEPAADKSAAPRIRQSLKSKSNKLEAEFGLYLRALYPGIRLWEQGVRLSIANGCTYTIDWAATIDKQFWCWEVKGKHSWDDAIVKLKVAAACYPAFRFMLVDKIDGRWRLQEVLP